MLAGGLQRRDPGANHAFGHVRRREALALGASGDSRVRAAQVRIERAAPDVSSSNGAHSVPATARRASGCTPTGVASTGTSQASASSTARPNPSRSDRDEHGVGRVDPKRHERRVDAAERTQLDARAARERKRPVVALLPTRGARGEQHEASLVRRGRAAPGRACGESGESARGPHRRAAPGRGAARTGPGARRPAAPMRRRRCPSAGSPSAVSARVRGTREVAAVDGQRAHARSHGERRPGAEAEVGVDDVESLRPLGAGADRARRAPAHAFRARSRTAPPSTPSRRRRASTWSRTNRPRSGLAAAGSMFETTSARTGRGP